MSEGTVPGEVLAELGVLVLEASPPDGWRLTAPPPDWLQEWGSPSGIVDTGALTERFPFLEHFLTEAEGRWHDGSREALKSGVWTETDPDGEELHLEATAMRLGERPILVVGRVEPERQELLQRARESELGHLRLRREIEKKEVLFHYIVHDLANPLSAIAGSLSLLRHQPLSSEAEDLIDLCRQSSDRAQRLIRDVMEIFVEENRALSDFQMQAIQAPDAAAVMTETVRLMEPSFRANRVSLEARVEPRDDWRVVGDPSRLERVLANLVENAQRHSRPGQTVTVSVAARSGVALFAVDDEGPGVPPEIRGVLFDKFSRGRQGAGKSGIGLHFCRITVERWGGRIGYEERLEGGSRFWFELPLIKPTP